MPHMAKAKAPAIFEETKALATELVRKVCGTTALEDLRIALHLLAGADEVGCVALDKIDLMRLRQSGGKRPAGGGVLEMTASGGG